MTQTLKFVLPSTPGSKSDEDSVLAYIEEMTSIAKELAAAAENASRMANFYAREMIANRRWAAEKAVEVEAVNELIQEVFDDIRAYPEAKAAVLAFGAKHGYPDECYKKLDHSLAGAVLDEVAPELAIIDALMDAGDDVSMTKAKTMIAQGQRKWTDASYEAQRQRINAMAAAKRKAERDAGIERRHLSDGYLSPGFYDTTK